MWYVHQILWKLLGKRFYNISCCGQKTQPKNIFSQLSPKSQHTLDITKAEAKHARQAQRVQSTLKHTALTDCSYTFPENAPCKEKKRKTQVTLNDNNKAALFIQRRGLDFCWIRQTLLNFHFLPLLQNFTTLCSHDCLSLTSPHRRPRSASVTAHWNWQRGTESLRTPAAAFFCWEFYSLAE